MKIQVLFCILFVGFLGLCQAQDLSEILKDKAYVKKQIDCVLERGPCDAIGEYLVSKVPDALNNNCGQCTAEEVKIAQQLTEFMKREYPEEWSEIVDLYSEDRSQAF